MPHRLARLLSAASLAALLALSTTASALAVSDGQAISVTPGQLNFILSKDAPGQTLTINITNGHDSSVTLVPSFKGIDENAGLLVPIGSPPADLARAMQLSDDEITIPAHGTSPLDLHVDNLPGLSPGGHYATLVLTQVSNSPNQVSLQAAVSLTIFVTKVQGAHHELVLSSVKRDGFPFAMPTSVELTFNNSGNIHVIPRASVNILSSNYLHTYAHGIANQQSLVLLPSKQLVTPVPISEISHGWLPMKLLLVAQYRTDGETVTKTVSQTFWYIPPICFVLLLAILAVIWGLLRSRKGRQAQERAKRSLVAIRDGLKPRRHVPVREQGVASPVDVKLAHPAISELPAIKPASKSIASVTPEYTPMVEPKKSTTAKPKQSTAAKATKSRTKKSTTGNAKASKPKSGAKPKARKEAASKPKTSKKAVKSSTKKTSATP